MRRDVVGSRAFHGRILEGTHAVELRFVQPGQQLVEFGFGLAGEAHDERGADGEIRTDTPPGLDPVERLLDQTRALHALEH
jgi:hypothetical protein